MTNNWFKQALNRMLRLRGREIILSERVYPWQRETVSDPTYRKVPLTPEVHAYLRADNPALLNLQQRYSAFNAHATTPLLWQEGHLRAEDIPYFRGDNAYVWQVRGQNTNIVGYTLAFYYLKSIDPLNLLDRMTEDGAFGSFTFRIGDRDVSRDLLDSVAEIYFLERHLQITKTTGFTILDIGAGYGRLAHRATQAWPNLEHYFCTDAVASSTFLSDFYLRFRETGEKAKAILLDEVEQTLASTRVDLAVNIHSFSECQPDAIAWWVDLIARNGVKYLMIVPNSAGPEGKCVLDNNGQDFTAILERFGYRLFASEPKFRDPIIQQYAIYPAHYFLFQLA